MQKRTFLILSFLGSLILAVETQASSSLLTGALSDVPPSEQPCLDPKTPDLCYRSLVDGGPLHIMSAVTGVEFHVPNKRSSEEGGLSPVPQPILRKANGVEYWFLSGEISGYTTEELGQHIVIGPIDPQGVNHRNETFCAPCSDSFEDRSLCCAPDQAVANPRAGLNGAFFGLSIPVKGFNSSLVNIEPAGDGGTGWPAAPMVFNPVDPVALMERGYGVFTFGQGGTVHEGTLPDGSKAVDTNPYSGTGIFWDEPDFVNGEPQGVISYSRFSYFDEKTGEETTYPAEFVLTARFGVPDGFEFCEIFAPECHREGSTCFCVVPFGYPGFFIGSFQKWGTELISDTVIFAKNLVRSVFSKPVTWAAYVGWSGSGAPAIQIASSTRGGAFQVEERVGPQAGGGNYRIYGKPRSGLRYNAFVSYAGVNDFQAYVDQRDGLVFGSADVHPDFPIAGSFVWLVPEEDVTLPTSAAYDHANKIWRALEKQNRGSDINKYFRIYSLPKATHQSRDQLYSAFDSRDGQGGLWYDLKDLLPNPGAFNEERRGLRVSGPYADALPFNQPYDNWDFFFHGKARVPRDTALWLQTFENLRLNAAFGIPLPVSRVNSELFKNIDSVSTDTRLPTYPTIEFPGGLSDEEFFALVYEIQHSITEDTGTFAWQLEPIEVAEFKDFVHNPLKRSLKPLRLPDGAAPLGINFYFFDLVFQAPFTREEFRARYGSRLGYVATFAAATLDLMDDRLWDIRYGVAQILEALKNPIEFAPAQNKSAPSRSSVQTFQATGAREMGSEPSLRGNFRGTENPQQGWRSHRGGR